MAEPANPSRKKRKRTSSGRSRPRDGASDGPRRGRKPRRDRDDFDDDLDDIDEPPRKSDVDPEIYKIEIPEEKLDFDTLKIVRRLQRHGHEAYLVGGCVRDLLLDRTPKDFDVATSARPRQIKRLFRNCRIIGRRFKLAHIHFGDNIVEVSTFRQNPAEDQDGNNDDAEQGGDDLLIRRDNVYGTSVEDAMRRDFTINALFYNVETSEVLDYVGGMQDIERRKLDTIGVPSIRFREDPVRILRCAEFSARLDFEIEPHVREAMQECGPEIERAAKPRVLEELLQALSCGKSARVFETMVDLDILDYIIPEIGDMEEIDRFLAYLEEVDVEDDGQRKFGDALLLAMLFLVRIEEEEDLYADDLDGPPINPLEPVDKIFGPFADRMGVSRKNAQRFREIYLGLRRLQERGTRKTKPETFVRRQHFPETLAAFKISLIAEDLPLERYRRWQSRYEDHAKRRGGKARNGRAKSR